MCDENRKYRRYVTLGLRKGQLLNIIARRGFTPDDIIDRTLKLVEPAPFLASADRSARKFEKLYIMEIGDEGSFGGSMNLKLLEIKQPPPWVPWTLIPVKSIF